MHNYRALTDVSTETTQVLLSWQTHPHSSRPEVWIQTAPSWEQEQAVREVIARKFFTEP